MNLRLSEAELAELAAAAGKANVTVAGYAAKASLSTARAEMPPDAVEFGLELFATRTQVAKVGVNLNQIAKVLNSGGAVDDERLAVVLADQRTALRAIDALTNELIKAMQRRRRQARAARRDAQAEPGEQQHDHADHDDAVDEGQEHEPEYEDWYEPGD